MGNFWLTSWLLGESHCGYRLVARGHKRISHEKLHTYFTELNGILLNKILVTKENFEKCNVAMLGGPCSQHVTGNTSRLYQAQSAIIQYNDGTSASRRSGPKLIAMNYIDQCRQNQQHLDGMINSRDAVTKHRNVLHNCSLVSSKVIYQNGHK